ncbi:hypothetical protein KRR38_25055 [Novosphingobium sp. G106]|uniref:hypothetical protein n=1 Tax=Novosphingobium sp. G106 TaxID=2849500 RepID=UPI001C2D3D59|nr:hypothetical protein [Novosphingobium sp. G106]MBV1690857.1 hypothetical protein [Novosphingobium sp. G106]
MGQRVAWSRRILEVSDPTYRRDGQRKLLSERFAHCASDDGNEHDNGADFGYLDCHVSCELSVLAIAIVRRHLKRSIDDRQGLSLRLSALSSPEALHDNGSRSQEVEYGVDAFAHRNDEDGM